MAQRYAYDKGPHVTESTRESQKRILQLRREGVHFGDIAKELAMSQANVYKIYKSALRDIIVEDVEELRKVEIAKLDVLEHEVMTILRSFHVVISNGRVVRDVAYDQEGNPILDSDTGDNVVERMQDHGVKLAAIDRAIKIMERRARLLGLDAPTKIAPTNPDGNRPYVVTIQASEIDDAL